jgi:hypothetical protein
MLALQEQLSHPCGQSTFETKRVGWTQRPAGSSSASSSEGASAPLRALAGNALDARFRSWRGASGRRYIFSIFDRQSCPAYEHVVAMIAAVDPDGERRIIFIDDTGCFPDLALATALKGTPVVREIEFHVHLLATSRAERTAMIADLTHARRS